MAAQTLERAEVIEVVATYKHSHRQNSTLIIASLPMLVQELEAEGFDLQNISQLLIKVLR